MSVGKPSLAGLWSGFIDRVAGLCEEVIERRRPTRRLRISEVAEDRFVMDGPASGDLILADGRLSGEGLGALAEAARGARVELTLRPDRFMLRRLPLPAQAQEFVGDILRTQIDRLTPWTADQACFGHRILSTGADGIVVGIAATKASSLAPLLDALSAHAPGAIDVVVDASLEEETPSIAVLSRAQGQSRRAQVRRVLVAGLVGSWGLAGLAWAASEWQASVLQDRYDATQARLAELRKVGTAANGPGALEQQILARKLSVTPVTLLLEEVSRLLPDDAHLTDMELSGGVVRLTGNSPDPAGLIRRVESSGILRDASFFAPTTRDVAGRGEQFHIEAKLRNAGATP